MNDPRMTPFNGRVAHESLRGQVEAEQFVEGERAQIAVPVAALCRTLEGPRDRELLFGQEVLLMDQNENGWC